MTNKTCLRSHVEYWTRFHSPSTGPSFPSSCQETDNPANMSRWPLRHTPSRSYSLSRSQCEATVDSETLKQGDIIML